MSAVWSWAGFGSQPPRLHWDRTRDVVPIVVAGAALAFLFLWLVFVVVSSRGSVVDDGPVSVWFSAHRTLGEGQFGLTVASATSPAVLCGAVVVAGVVLFFRGWRLEAVTLVVATVMAYVVGAAVKFAVARPRPLSPVNLSPESEPSFPSGHVLVVATVAFVALGLAWGYLGKVGRILGTVVAVAVTVLIGVDRLVVGAHWLTDVVASVALALALVAVVLSAYLLLKPDGAELGQANTATVG